MNLPTVICLLILACIATLAGWITMILWFGWKLWFCIFLVMYGNMLRLKATEYLGPLWKKHVKEMQDG